MTTTRYPHLRAALLNRPWALSGDWLLAMVEMVEARVEGIRLSAEEVALRAGAHSHIEVNATVAGVRVPNGLASHFALDAAGSLVAARGERTTTSEAQPASLIAVISVMGVIAQHASQVDDISGPGGTSTERLGQSFQAALNDPSVKAIVLNVDSPGGNVHGVMEVADLIYKARGTKPVVAQVNSTAASAAYWIACSADEIVVTPGGEVGSIGVFGMHKDVSAAAEKQGLKVTFISAGKHKVDGNPFEPISDEFRAAAQADVDTVYASFVAAVARGRGVKASDVRNGFGEGRTVLADQAVKLGMADRTGTMDDTLRRLAKAKPGAGPRADTSGTVTLHSTDLPASDEPSTGQETEASDIPAGPSAEQIAAEQAERQAAIERDAFRRRRHAHRQRSA